MAFKDELLKILSEDQLQINEPMRDHTTFRIGGPADYLVNPTISQIQTIIELCKQKNIPCTIIGNGSNLLVGDQGIRGVVIAIGTHMNQIAMDADACIHVQAGAMLSTVAAKAARESLSGLEFASGIPGTIGGALNMNAGAYGGEMKDVIKEITILTPEGKIEQLDAHSYEGGYRMSAVMKQKAIVLEAILQLKKGSPDIIAEEMDRLKKRRIEKQPLEYPSAGSTFKRPEGYFAGKLIMDCNLSGYTVGGAQVSQKHCGFVINKGNATARDVRTLMEDVSKKVEETYHVPLEPEVRFLGEF